MIQRLMRQLNVIVVREQRKPLGDGSPTADPRIMKAVEPHIGGVKLRFDEISADVVQMTAQV
jgi:hypothetical protein